VHKLPLWDGGGHLSASVVMVPMLGTEFVPKADFSETSITFYTPVGSALEVTEAKARQVEAIVREFPEVRYTLSTINTGNAQGKIYANVYVRLVDRKDRSRSVDQMSGVLRTRLPRCRGITVTHVGLLDSVGGNKQVEFSLQGPDLRELERLARLATAQDAKHPGLVDLDSSVKPDKPVIDVDVKRDAASDLGLSVDADCRAAAHPGGRPDRGQLARQRRPDLRRERAAGARRPQRAAPTWSACRLPPARLPTAARASCG
jgi:HAE1 family hydrophobic/amphiphilic exporter-1